jgi:CheY-like chemotaxis protein
MEGGAVDHLQNLVGVAKMKVLIVDDARQNHILISGKFAEDTEFEFVDIGPDEVTQALSAGPYSVVLVDLMLFGSDPVTTDWEGLQVIAEARKRLPGVVIVAYSAAISEAAPETFEHYGRCRAAGADHVVPRRALTVGLKAELAAQLRAWVEEKRLASESINPIVFVNDLATDAIRERVSDDRLRIVVRHFVRDGASAQVRSLRAGASGAIVASVVAKHKSGSKAQLVVKLSQGVDALPDELGRQPVVGGAVNWKAPQPVMGKALDIGAGWQAVAFAAVRGAKPLRSVVETALAGGNARSAVAAVRKVVSDILVPVAQEATWPEVAGETPGEPLWIKAGAAVEILEFVDRVQSWRIPARERASLELCKALVGRLVRRESMLRLGSAPQADGHGDFHSENVFVGTGGVFVIDFGRGGRQPRLLDFAALDVDVLLRIMDSHLGRDQDPGRIVSWLRACVREFPFRPLGASSNGGGAAVTRLRRTIHRGLTGLENVGGREYAQSMLLHCLRYLRFKDVAVAKRRLAALLTAELWKLCDDSA